MKILKNMQFFIAVLVICVAKIWLDSFRSYIKITSACNPFIDASRMLGLNVNGLMIGGGLAGIFTDALTPKRTGIVALSAISLLSLLMLLPYLCQFEACVTWFYRISIALFLVALTVARTWMSQRLSDFAVCERKSVTLCIILSLADGVLTLAVNQLISIIFSAVLGGNYFMLERGDLIFIPLYALMYLLRFYVGDPMFAGFPVVISSSAAIIIRLRALLLRGDVDLPEIGLMSLIYLMPYTWFYEPRYRWVPRLMFFIIGFCIFIPLFQNEILLQPMMIAGFKVFMQAVIFVRGLFLGAAMNSAYAIVGYLYRGSPSLSKATSIVYASLFGCLFIAPSLLESFFSLWFFISMLCITILLIPMIMFWPTMPSKGLHFKNSFKSMILVAKNGAVILAVFVSMLFVGGFYNIIGIFQNTDRLGLLPYRMERMQSMGRFLTFMSTILMIFLPRSCKIDNKNCVWYIVFCLLVSISMSLALICAGITEKYGIYIVYFFAVNCFALGIAQAVSKILLLAAANKQSVGSISLCGGAQSLSTFANSLIECIGCVIIPPVISHGFIARVLAYNFATGLLALIALLCATYWRGQISNMFDHKLKSKKNEGQIDLVPKNL